MPIGVGIHIMWIGFVATEVGLEGNQDTHITFEARESGLWERIDWP